MSVKYSYPCRKKYSFVLLLILYTAYLSVCYPTVKVGVIDKYINRYLEHTLIDKDLIEDSKHANNYKMKDNFIYKDGLQDYSDINNVVGWDIGYLYWYSIRMDNILQQLAGTRDKLIDLVEYLEESKKTEELNIEEYFYKSLLKYNSDQIYDGNRDLEWRKSIFLNQQIETLQYRLRFLSNNMNEKEFQGNFLRLDDEITAHYKLLNEESSTNSINSSSLKRIDISKGFLTSQKILNETKIINQNRNNQNKDETTLESLLFIGSPVVSMDFNRLVLVDEIVYRMKPKNYIHKIYYSTLKKLYPNCEIRYILRDLKNRLQWKECIIKDNIFNLNFSSVKSYKVCDKILFHNCVGLEIKEIYLTVLKDYEKATALWEPPKKLVQLFEAQMQNDNEDQSTSTYITKMNLSTSIIIHELLEKSAYLIRRDKRTNSLNISLIKASTLSKQFYTLREIVSNPNLRLKLNNKRKITNRDDIFSVYDGSIKISSDNNSDNQDFMSIEQLIGILRQAIECFRYSSEMSCKNKLSRYFVLSIIDNKVRTFWYEMLINEYKQFLNLRHFIHYISAEELIKLELFYSLSLISNAESTENEDKEIYYGSLGNNQNIDININQVGKCKEIPNHTFLNSDFRILEEINIKEDIYTYQNNIENFGKITSFIHYYHQLASDLDHNTISSPPWWMTWQYNVYPSILTHKDPNNLSGNDEHNTWLELPVHSDFQIHSFDSYSIIPSDILSYDILKYIFMEETELQTSVNDQASKETCANTSYNITAFIKAKQMKKIEYWAKLDIMNSEFSNYQNVHEDYEENNPCLSNYVNENLSLLWKENCIKKWELYIMLNKEFHSQYKSTYFIEYFTDILDDMVSVYRYEKMSKTIK
ncbi:hypothetical protein cand_037780 [Cryptosporidium andersoni]|uniref:Uncharacterized protein n=1 Tax=Cryptosporidium andersoni TaxID=117008 RepID=A0A1J4MUP1_9CRYT|nr:hypothetical protein cand_037780 [Cryptosporidium andersoni]